jgi:hypothetical protein
MLLWAALWINDVYGQIGWCTYQTPNGPVKAPCIGPGGAFLAGVLVGAAVATAYFILAKAAPRDTPTSTVTEKKKE